MALEMPAIAIEAFAVPALLVNSTRPSAEDLIELRVDQLKELDDPALTVASDSTAPQVICAFAEFALLRNSIAPSAEESI